MSELSKQIKAEAHWSVQLRPKKFDENHVRKFSSLEQIIRSSSVRIRGWDFPHLDLNKGVHRSSNYIYSEVSWGSHVEHWRLYTSGMFYFVGRFSIDLLPRDTNTTPPLPNHQFESLLGVSDTVARYLEFFKFASAMIFTEAGAEEVVLKVGAHGLRDRELWVDDWNRFPFHPGEFKFQLEEFVQKDAFSIEKLSSNFDALAIEWSKNLLERAGWTPSVELLKALWGKV